MIQSMKKSAGTLVVLFPFFVLGVMEQYNQSQNRKYHGISKADRDMMREQVRVGIQDRARLHAEMEALRKDTLAVKSDVASIKEKLKVLHVGVR